MSLSQYITLDWRVPAFAAGTALLTGLLFGVLPASLMGRMLPAADVGHSQPGVHGAAAGRMRSVPCYGNRLAGQPRPETAVRAVARAWSILPESR